MKPSTKKMRKVFVTVPTEGGSVRESLWAYEVSKKTARISSIPFLTSKVAFDDLVRVNKAGDVLEVITSVNTTWCACYEASEDRNKALRQWQEINDHLKPHGILCESAVAGMFSMAIPRSLPEERILDICKQCPIPLKLQGVEDPQPSVPPPEPL